MLGDAFNSVLATAEADNSLLWSADSGDVISAVAARLAVPGWLAGRRLADEALLENEALYHSMGGEL